MEFRQRSRGRTTYPCGVCKAGTGRNSIECVTCQQWIHRRCVHMNAALLDVWGAIDYDFHCGKCIFTDDVYDAGAALRRLLVAITDHAGDARTKVVGQENLMLQTYGIQLPEPDKRAPEIIPGHRDTISAMILDSLCPELLLEHVPLAVAGDGNCLFRSLSRALYGTEEKHMLLRLLSTLELASFPQHYDHSQPGFVDLVRDQRIVLPEYWDALRMACADGAYTEMIHPTQNRLLIARGLKFSEIV